VTKLIRALASLALIFALAGSALAGVRDQGANLYNSTKIWSALNYNNEWIALIDPYSVFKVSDVEWDVNITFMNNQNQYDPNQTFTYRIDCSNIKFKTQGWRINGVIKNYTDPYGLGLNFTKNSIPYGSIMWTAKEYVCGVSHSGSTYYWAYSSFRNSQMRGALDQWWFKDNIVTVSQDDRNLRRVNLMMSVLGGTQPNFSEFFAKCDKREWMEAANGVATTDWSPIPAASGIEVFFDKMCSNRYSFITYQTNSVTMPTPKLAPPPVPVSETSEQPKNGSGMDEAKRKCGDLGFLAGTPKFGQCVLKLTQ
jgi:hypothetical protein